MKYNKPAGCLGKRNFRRIEIHGKQYQITHVIWAMHTGKWPAEQIDHINQNRLDNRMSNLREATAAQNTRNRKSKNPLTKGVCINKGAYQARITVDGKTFHLGRFRTCEEAAKAYQEACVKYHGEFACPIN